MLSAGCLKMANQVESIALGAFSKVSISCLDLPIYSEDDYFFQNDGVKRSKIV